ncbi:hypothetical protein L218DRAFT_241318 [Marasmius fiardii PR-910]|nr:hypothetical protein L218DRAFT_241318 [Marasmius fiardii PR-910]
MPHDRGSTIFMFWPFPLPTGIRADRTQGIESFFLSNQPPTMTHQSDPTHAPRARVFPTTPGEGILKGLQLTAWHRVIIGLLNCPLVDQETLGPNRACCLACGARIKFQDTNYTCPTFYKHIIVKCEKAQKAQELVNQGKSFPYAERMDPLIPLDLQLDKEEILNRRGLYSDIIMEVKRRKAMEKAHLDHLRRSPSFPAFPASTLQTLPPNDSSFDLTRTAPKRPPQSPAKSKNLMIRTLSLPPVPAHPPPPPPRYIMVPPLVTTTMNGATDSGYNPGYNQLGHVHGSQCPMFGSSARNMTD